MHRAGILSPGNLLDLHDPRQGSGFSPEILAGIFFEFLQAVVTAKIIPLPLVFIGDKGTSVFSTHAADRIRITCLLIVMVDLLYFFVQAS
jgi:hypothetical protein